MKQLSLLACMALLAAGEGVHAQSIEATRYINRDGIEVIQSRSQALPAAAGAVTDRLAPAEPARAARPAGVKMQPMQAASDPRMQVSAREQSARDKDRLAILNEELYKEIANYESKSKVLRTPSMRGKLSEDELARVREIASDHEKNIRALMAEIAGVRK